MKITNDLVCQFLNDDPVFAYGVEFGILWMRMKEEDEIQGYFTTENQEQITLAANRGGFEIVQMKQWKKGPEWTWFHLRRK